MSQQLALNPALVTVARTLAAVVGQPIVDIRGQAAR